MNEFSLILLATSFLAGILTVFAPCVFTFLPVILGTSNINQEKNYKKALTIIISLGLSVFVFSLLLKASTALIQVPQSFWDIVAGTIITVQGLFLLLPEIWDKLSTNLGLNRSNSILNNKPTGIVGDVLTGVALGPIFSSCSPTYGFIIGALLQSTFSVALIYLVIYIIGVCIILFVIAALGQAFIKKFKWGTNPKGMFKRIVASIFILIGILILTGYYKNVETYIIENLPFLDVTRIDLSILQSARN